MGSFIDNVGVFDNDERVYSPNNPPPAPPGGGIKFQQLFMEGGLAEYFALDFDGRLWGWGLNDASDLAQGYTATVQQRGFVLIQLPYSTHRVADIYMQGRTVYAKLLRRVDNRVELWGWGEGTAGQFGSNVNVHVPELIAAGLQNIWPCREGTYAAGGMIYYRANGSTAPIKCLGRSAYGRTGDGNVGATTSGARNLGLPTGVSLSQVRDIWNMGRDFGCTFLRTTDGRMFGCGYNGYGTIGDGTTASKSSWTQVLGMSASVINSIVDITGGYGYHNASGEGYSGFTMVRTSNGDIWSTGWNTHNQNGLGVNASEFTKVYGGGYVDMITMGAIGTQMVKTSAGVHVWGYDELAVWTGRLRTKIDSTYIPNSLIRKTETSAPNITMCLSGWYRTYKRYYVFWWPNGKYYIVGRGYYGHHGSGTYDVIETFDNAVVRTVPIAPDESIVQMLVATYYDHPATYCLTDKGNLYHVGCADYNQKPKHGYGGPGDVRNCTWDLIN